MIPLAITSTAGWIRRLGGKRWSMLHRAIYISAVAGVIHFYWLVKSDVHLPLEYAAVISVLLAWRLYDWYSKPARRPVPNKSAARKESASAAAE
jgi:sulfoxide reductase heme-binding subunit YedZ